MIRHLRTEKAVCILFCYWNNFCNDWP